MGLFDVLGGAGQGLAEGLTALNQRQVQQQQLAQQQQSLDMQNQRQQQDLAMARIGHLQSLVGGFVANHQGANAAGALPQLQSAYNDAGMNVQMPAVSGGLAPVAGYKPAQVPNQAAMGPFDPKMAPQPTVADPTKPQVADWSQGTRPDFENQQTRSALLGAIGYMPGKPEITKFGNGRGGMTDMAVTSGIDGTVKTQTLGSTPATDMYTPYGVFNPTTQKMEYTFPTDPDGSGAAKLDLIKAQTEATRALALKRGASGSAPLDPVETARIMQNIEGMVSKRFPFSMKEKAGLPDASADATRDQFRQSLQRQLLPGVFGGGAPATDDGAKLGSLINQAAHKYGIDPALMTEIGRKESGLSLNAARGTSGEVGPFQVMPDMHGVSAQQLADPATNVDTAARLLSGLIKQYGSVQQAIKHYNGSGLRADAYAADILSRYRGNGLAPKQAAQAPAAAAPAGKGGMTASNNKWGI